MPLTIKLIFRQICKNNFKNPSFTGYFDSNFFERIKLFVKPVVNKLSFLGVTIPSIKSATDVDFLQIFDKTAISRRVSIAFSFSEHGLFKKKLIFILNNL